MRFPAKRPDNISDIMDWFSEFQMTTGDAVWYIAMPKKLYTRVLKLLDGMLVEKNWLYGALMLKDSNLKDEIEIFGWAEYAE